MLNPGLVLAEIALNLMAVIMNRRGSPRVFRRILPMLPGSLPGIGFGIFFLKTTSADSLRLITFVVLLCRSCSSGGRIPPAAATGQPGGSAGRLRHRVLYSCTAISGPPLGLCSATRSGARRLPRGDEFVRVTRSVVTSLGYLGLSVYSPQSVSLSPPSCRCILIRNSCLGGSWSRRWMRSRFAACAR